MMLAAVAGYAVKILAVMGLISALKHVTVWNPRAFAWTVIVLVLTWIVAEFRVALKVRSYVDEPAGSGTQPVGTMGNPQDRST
jgi:ATP synthase protein I